MAKTKPVKSKQSPAKRNTITQSLSFKWRNYEILEAQRVNGRPAMTRTSYIERVLQEHWVRIGVLKSGDADYADSMKF